MEPTIGGLNMALPNIVGGNIVVREKAIGGFEHCAAATGFRQCGTGPLGARVGSLDQTLGPPQVAEVRVGKFCDGPARSIEAVAHV